jgi:hypothetical protein
MCPADSWLGCEIPVREPAAAECGARVPARLKRGLPRVAVSRRSRLRSGTGCCQGQQSGLMGFRLSPVTGYQRNSPASCRRVICSRGRATGYPRGDAKFLGQPSDDDMVHSRNSPRLPAGEIKKPCSRPPLLTFIVSSKFLRGQICAYQPEEPRHRPWAESAPCRSPCRLRP